MYIFYFPHFVCWLLKFYCEKFPHRYTQSEANQTFEKLQPDLAQWYANSSRALSSGLFMLPIIPYGIIFSLIAIVLQHLTDKYTILRRYARPVAEGPELALSIFCGFDWVILAFTLGQCCWDYILRRTISNYSWFMLFFSSTMLF